MRGVAWKSILTSLLFCAAWWVVSKSLNVFVLSSVLSVLANAKQPRLEEAMTRAVIIGLIVMVGDIYLYRLR